MTQADTRAVIADYDERTLAPPRPGITVNGGCTVFAVLPDGTGDRSWYVAAGYTDATGMHHAVTWWADTSPDGRLVFWTGDYSDGPDEARVRARALVSLAERAGVFGTLTALNEPMRGTREYETDASADRIAAGLETHAGIPRRRTRSVLRRAAEFGSARITGRDGKDWTVTFDRHRCTYDARAGR